MQNVLTKKEALQAMREGKTIGFATIKGVEMWKDDSRYLFKHKCGKIENLHYNTMSDDNGYVIVDNTHKNVRIVTNRYLTLQLTRA